MKIGRELLYYNAEDISDNEELLENNLDIFYNDLKEINEKHSL